MKCDHRMEITASRLYFRLAYPGGHRGICTTFICCKDYYSVLGVARNATQKEIRGKYMELCKLYHPDKMVSGDAKEQEKQKVKFQEVNEAYENLSKMDTRSAHDYDLRSGATTSRGPYRGGNYTGYTQYNRRRYEGKPPNSDNTDGWSSSWSEWDRYKEDEYGKKYNEDEFYRQQYMRNKQRWNDDLNKWKTYSNYYKKSSPFGNPFHNSYDEGPGFRGQQFSNTQVVRFCLSLLGFSILFHFLQSMAIQRETDNYYDRTRQYYKNYDSVKANSNG